MADALDNPVWAALTSAHAPLALGDVRARRYPADVAPFVAVTPDVDPDLSLDAIAALTAPGESIVFVGAMPARTGGFEIEQRARVLQMHYESATVSGAPEGFDELGPAHAASMLELTGLVYPGYFRARTPVMGRYYGVHDGGGRLIAMAGERMRTDTDCEISGVCTHPDFVGRGLAGRLVRHVTAGILARGEHVLLHVSPENTRAVRLYESLGFATRVELPLLRMRRLAA
ncbi:MAG TPA: GNAT family N-acetyltransferase [Candidatus Saccharimonadia bacterium]|nr:GNAT family N-acetyltransferase [Candidatus Saccharimonadia bacterium]